MRIRIAATSARLLVLAFLTLVTFFAFTGLLTRGYRTEREARARLLQRVGQELAQQGRHEEAIEEYRAALSLVREDLDCRLALALELSALGRTREAEIHLAELLKRDPTSGTANLLRARIEGRRGQTADAILYYRRAIYGLWEANALNNRTEARFELVDLLLRRGALNQVKAQLLQLADEIPDDPVVKKRVGNLLLAAEAPEEAAWMFRQVLRNQSLDAEAYAGLGSAEMAMGDYPSARGSLRLALKWNPHDAYSRQRLELLDRVLALDPTLRGLPLREKHARSRLVVERAIAALNACLATQTGPVPSVVLKALDAGRQSAGAGGLTLAAVEANYSAAEQLQAARMLQCPAGDGGDPVLTMVLTRLTK